MKLTGNMLQTIHSLLLKAHRSAKTVGISPSLLAAAAIVVLRRLQGYIPYWPPVLQSLTGYNLEASSDLHACVLHIEQALLPNQ